MKKGSIEDLFITYANLPLSDDPKYFRDIRNEIFRYFALPADMESSLRILIEILIRITGWDDYDKAKKYVEDLKSRRGPYKSYMTGIALDSIHSYVYGETDIYCQKGCSLRIERRRSLGKSHFSGTRRLKCYECDQQYFTYILSEIIAGREYSHIIGFAHFISEYRGVIKPGIIIEHSSSSSPFKEDLRASLTFDAIAMNINLGFFLRGLVSYSLSEFLVHDDRRKIKKCEQCGEYYISELLRSNQKFCKKKCKRASKWPPEKWAKYMKDYRAIKSKQKQREYDEMRIQRMISGGYTREYAIEILKAEKEMDRKM